VQNSNWLKKFEPIRNGVVSGWMALRGARRRRNADKGFVLSDHADWEGLNEAISLTGAENIFVTHGYTDILSKWLIGKGLNANPLETNFEGDEVL
jgi:putative mRNA 3-end processing factor